MNIITLDFETYFSDDYTLKTMTTEAYVRNPRFEVHGCAVSSNGQKVRWFRGDELRAALASIDWSTCGALCHHAHFDGLILVHHYGIKPAFWFDTLSMARLMLGNHVSASLDSLSKHFGLAAKSVPYEWFKGRHWNEITRDVQERLAEGCCNDTRITWDLFCKLAEGFPPEEYALVDATVRLFTEPVLVGNTALLADIWQREQMAKSQLLAELAVSGKQLRANEVFADLLRAEGVEPETKEGKNGPIYAFAQTDDFMRECLEDDNPRVQALAEARLSEKSAIVQTRSARLGWMSTRGTMPVYLSYCGAHTSRWSGGDKVNWQNFPRDSDLGKAIEAPRGHMVVVADASQVECRGLEMLAGEVDGIEEFRRGEDPYIKLASQFYQRPITKADKEQRQFGKVLRLQCGFGAGGPSIVRAAKKGKIPVFITDEQGMQARDLYRSEKRGVVSLWKDAGEVLKKINSGMEFDWLCMCVKNKRVYLPNGIPLIYETLEWYTAENGDSFWRIKTRKGYAKLYGAKFVENFVQALFSRLLVSQAWLRCAKAGIRVVSNEHDKIVAVVGEREAESAFAFMKQELSRPPEWLPDIPLSSDGYISHTFAEEKHG